VVGNTLSAEVLDAHDKWKIVVVGGAAGLVYVPEE